jgi:hypothetical protein
MPFVFRFRSFQTYNRQYVINKKKFINRLDWVLGGRGGAIGPIGLEIRNYCWYPKCFLLLGDCVRFL